LRGRLGAIGHATRHVRSSVWGTLDRRHRVEITSAGNIYRHVYHNLTAAEVWVTATKDLDPLLAAVDTELAAA